ncbi:c-type cytochrome [Aidingimonas lacisalsi]|uniref:c-type cytochrome n=1 Tax=Aidingimonas lacisalsi TaxID=2604086 RepID=UPI00191C18FB|nr:cytochrome c [Aidingimonas lacisalsi]
MFATKANTTEVGPIRQIGGKWLMLSLGIMGSMLTLMSAAIAEDDGNDVTNYTVKDGKVDQATYDGYEAYTRVCQACHGPDGLGSSFAPSLMEISETRTLGEFVATVANGQEIQPGKVMPSFADDQYVMNNVNNIYRYMKARAAGDVGRGRPDVIGDGDDKEASDSDSDQAE